MLPPAGHGKRTKCLGPSVPFDYDSVIELLEFRTEVILRDCLIERPIHLNAFPKLAQAALEGAILNEWRR
jgi:hypothetical protein